MKRSHRAYDALKRAADVIIAALALIVLSPVIALTALVVRASLGSPVLFRQQRPGLSGKPFTLLKFRTMLETDAQGVAAVSSDAERLTPIGRALRRLSLDELPQLWNVVRGDMSLVGPRPLLMEYLPRYNERQARRHEVRPGITGLAQVSGRNTVAWDDRLDLDVYYVDNRSPGLDLKILLSTAAAVFSRSGVSAHGEATMRPFDPSSDKEDR